MGFLLYLTCIDNLDFVEETVEELAHLGGDAKIIMDVDDEEIKLPTSEESALVEKFNPAIFRVDAIIKVEDDLVPVKREDNEINSLKLLPLLPTYCFNERRIFYLMTSNILSSRRILPLLSLQVGEKQILDWLIAVLAHLEY